MHSLLFATLFAVVQAPGPGVPVHFGIVSAHILPSNHASVETSAPSVLLPEARRLVRLALAEADADMVAQHDSLEFDRPYVTRLATAPGLEAIEYRVVFKQGTRTTDD